MIAGYFDLERDESLVIPERFERPSWAIYHPFVMNKTYNLNIIDKIIREPYLSKLDDLFDDLFSIEEVRIYKPDSKVYDLPIKKYKIEKNEVAFLSANTWDVSGGGNYGFNSIWVNRNNSIFDNLDYKPKYEIKNLIELTKLI